MFGEVGAERNCDRFQRGHCKKKKMFYKKSHTLTEDGVAWPISVLRDDLCL